MRIARQLGMLLVAVCALSAIAASSASAISGPLFLFHGTGPGTLLGSGTVQKLTTAAGKVECSAVKINKGAATALRFLSILVLVQYSSCTTELFGEATIAPVHFLIDANGLVALDNDVTIIVGGGLCKIQIPAAKNKSLPNAVAFTNNAVNGGILVSVKATGITSFGEGACAYAEEHSGTDEGLIHIVAHGGILRWDKNS